MSRGGWIFASLLVSVPVHAGEGLKINPGMWETTTEMTMSMLAQPIVKTDQQCMDKGEFKPEDLTKDSECTLESYDVSGNTMSFVMLCPGPEGSTQGEGTYVSEGNAGHGTMTISMTMGGQQHSMTMVWKGKRIGDC